MPQEGFLLVIDGPSAVGKSTIFRMLLSQQQVRFDLARRYTTRAKRAVDDDDDTYMFIAQGEFDRLVHDHAFIEHKCYKFGMCYGLPKSEVVDRLALGHHVIAMINLGNIVRVRSVIPNAFGVFVTASPETIRRRLEGRGTHPPEQIEERLGNARDSLRFLSLYDAVVSNDDRRLDDVVGEILRRFSEFLGGVSRSASRLSPGPDR